MQEPSTLQALKTAKVVNLRGNQIEHLPSDLNKVIPACKTLNLLDNPLSDVNKVIVALKPLRHL